MIIVVRLQGYSPPTLVLFARRQLPQLAAGSLVRRRESARPSRVRRCVARQARCVGSPTSPVAATRPAFFQLSPALDGECAYHRRQSAEPRCFQSMQPSFLLLDQAKFGLPDTEPDDGRVQDRNRLAAERVRFLLGEAV